MNRVQFLIIALLSGTSLIDVIARTLSSGPGTGSCPDGMEQIIKTDFGQWSKGKYTNDMIQKDFGTGTKIYSNDKRLSANIVSDDGNMVLGITYKAKCFGNAPGCTLHFKAPLGRSYRKVYYSMKLNFGGARGKFDWNMGGKLPGLCGGQCNAGGDKPSGYDGFSVRIMWRQQGSLMSYVYNVGMKGPWGTNLRWDTKAPQKKWIHVSQMVEMNKPGSSNGKITAWVNGQEFFYDNNIEWRKTDKFSVDTFDFVTFFGGNTRKWAPDSDMNVLYDDIIVCA